MKDQAQAQPPPPTMLQLQGLDEVAESIDSILRNMREELLIILHSKPQDAGESKPVQEGFPGPQTELGKEIMRITLRYKNLRDRLSELAEEVTI